MTSFRFRSVLGRVLAAVLMAGSSLALAPAAVAATLDESLKACEADIRAFAQKNGSCCTGKEAEKIIRKYFGLPEQTAAPKPEPAAPPAPAENIVNLEDFFG